MKEFNGGVINWDTVKRFLPDDNRFIIHILKKNRMYNYEDSELIEVCRFHLIKAISGWLDKGFKFDSEAHLVNFMSKSIFRAAISHFKSLHFEKNAIYNYIIRIDHEKDLNGGLFDSGDYLAAIGGYYNEQPCVEKSDVDLFIHIVEQRLGYEYADIVRRLMIGHTTKEIAESYDVTSDSVRYKVKKVARLYEKFSVYTNYTSQDGHGEGNDVYRGVRSERGDELERKKEKQKNHFSEIRNFLLSTSDAQAKEEVCH